MVAEGVEDAAALDLLRELGVDLAPGYHLCRPAAADEIRAWLRTCEWAGGPVPPALTTSLTIR
jgi:EAL domain-containing protein (putative c-di-GMP-specific phosphodiesterase class I)